VCNEEKMMKVPYIELRKDNKATIVKPTAKMDLNLMKVMSLLKEDVEDEHHILRGF